MALKLISCVPSIYDKRVDPIAGPWLVGTTKGCLWETPVHSTCRSSITRSYALRSSHGHRKIDIQKTIICFAFLRISVSTAVGLRSVPVSMAGKRVLILCSSHDKLGDTGKPTGVWAEELAAPYLTLKEAGVHVDVVSVSGGKIPIDPGSLQGALTEHTNRFMTEDELKSKLDNSPGLADVSEEYDAVFLPGGHGVCYDCPENPKVIALLEKFWAQGKILAAVCHGPVAFANVKSPSGEHIVKGRKVTGFTNSEEEAVGKTDAVPFLLEDRFKELGGLYERGPDWTPHAVADGKLITGQNPQSSVKVAELILAAL